MGGSKRRGAFTLIEVLIVVVIMAVLAATIIPQFTNSTTDAKVSTGRFNLHTLRSQIELYKLHHNGNLPVIDNNLIVLTKMTNAAGVAGTDATLFPFGPYIQRVPENPFTASAKVTATAGTVFGVVPGAATGASDAGWLYREATGEIFLDHEDHLAL